MRTSHKAPLRPAPFNPLKTDAIEGNRSDTTGGHAVHACSDELSHLKKLVLRQGAPGCDQLQRGVQTLKDEDPSAAGHVINRDREMKGPDLVPVEEMVRTITKR